MKLYDVLKLSDDELTIHDKDYDTEFYYYGIKGDNDKELDDWSKSLIKLSKHLEIEEIRKNEYDVNLSELIESKIEELVKADLFYECDIDDIIEDIDNIMAGFVSEDWMKKFVDIICR